MKTKLNPNDLRCMIQDDPRCCIERRKSTDFRWPAALAGSSLGPWTSRPPQTTWSEAKPLSHNQSCGVFADLDHMLWWNRSTHADTEMIFFPADLKLFHARFRHQSRNTGTRCHSYIKRICSAPFKASLLMFAYPFPFMSKSSKGHFLTIFSSHFWPLSSHDPPKPCPKRFLCASWSSVAVDPAAFPTSGTGNGDWGSGRWADIGDPPQPQARASKGSWLQGVPWGADKPSLATSPKLWTVWHRWNVSKNCRKYIENAWNGWNGWNGWRVWRWHVSTYFRFVKIVKFVEKTGSKIHGSITPQAWENPESKNRRGNPCASEIWCSFCLKIWYPSLPTVSHHLSIFFPLRLYTWMYLGEYIIFSHTHMSWSFHSYIDGWLTRTDTWFDRCLVCMRKMFTDLNVNLQRSSGSQVKIIWRIKLATKS